MNTAQVHILSLHRCLFTLLLGAFWLTGCTPASNNVKATHVKSITSMSPTVSASQVLTDIKKELQKARQSKDLIRLDCLQDKYAHARSTSYLLKQSNRELKKTQQEYSRKYYQKKIRFLQVKLKDIQRETSQCRGRVSSYTSNTTTPGNVAQGKPLMLPQ